MFNWFGCGQDNHQRPVDYLSRHRGAPETQIWADLRAIYIFEILEVAGLGIWLVKVLSVNPFFSLLPPSEESRSQSGLVISPAEVRPGALQGADSSGQLPWRAHHTANAP